MTKIKARAISARKLIETYEGLRGGPLATFDLLAYHLRQGNIRARAKHVWTSNEPMLSRAWKAEPDKEAYKNKSDVGGEDDVKRSVWRKSVHWQLDKDLWDIRNGRFIVTVREDPVRRVMIRGLRLHSGDARRLFDLPKLRKARDDKHDSWRAFWHEIIRLIQNGREDFGLLEMAGYASDVKLADKLTGHLSDLDVANRIGERIPFQLSDNQIAEEVAALRTAFGISNRRIDPKSESLSALPNSLGA